MSEDVKNVNMPTPFCLEFSLQEIIRNPADSPQSLLHLNSKLAASEVVLLPVTKVFMQSQANQLNLIILWAYDLSHDDVDTVCSYI